MRRKLALRLLAVSLPLAVLAALAAFFAERDRIGGDVLSFTVMQASLFNAEQGQLLDRLETADSADLERAMMEFTSRHEGGPLGRFDAVHLHRPSGELSAKFIRPGTLDAEAVDRLMLGERFPEHRQAWSEVARIGGAPYLFVQMPLVGSSGSQVGWMQGIFKPSRAIVASARRRALRSAIAVAAIVLAIAVTLWPLVA